MGKQIHLNKVKRLFEKSPVVNFKSIQRIVGKPKKGDYAKLLISNLIKKNEIKKLGKGVYTKFDDSALAVFVFKPAYLGLQAALSYHGLWEQETIPIILTTKKVRRGIRNAMGSNIFIRHISNKYFFGYEYMLDGDFYLPYSDVEKTFIDMAIFNQKMSKELLVRFKEGINKKKLEIYLKKYSIKFRKKVLKIIP